MSSKGDSSQSQTIEYEIEDLERRLREAKARFSSSSSNGEVISPPPPKILPSDGENIADSSKQAF
jgi:hypothetical protein